MFTGIIQKVSKITAEDRSDQAMKIALNPGWPDVVLGESIAVNGVCLTVAEIEKNQTLHFFVGFETLHRSNLGSLQVGRRVNLERALLASDRLSGHIVQGHVDGQAVFLGAALHSNAWDARFEVPLELSRYMVGKGSLSLNGTSLTIAAIKDSQAKSEISVMLIPHTWEHTSFSDLKAGDAVNVEVDVLAKYMEKLCQPYFKQ